MARKYWRVLGWLTAERLLPNVNTKPSQLLLAVILILAMIPLLGTQEASAPQSQSCRLGQEILLDGTRLRVVLGTMEEFAGANVQGTPIVVSMEFDSGSGWSMVLFEPGPEPSKSNLLLLVGQTEFAPIAFRDSFAGTRAGEPKFTLTKNLKMTPKGKKGLVMQSINGKLVYSWLFDVPTELSKKPMSASLKFLVGKEYSLLVALQEENKAPAKQN